MILTAIECFDFCSHTEYDSKSKNHTKNIHMTSYDN